MRYIYIILTLLIFVSSTAFAAGQSGFTADEQAYINKTKRITVGIVADDEPYSYMNHGQYEGFSHDVLKNLSKISGLEFDFRMGNWSEIYKSFMKGEIDAIDAISYTDERSKKILFTEPYSARKTVIFSRADNPVHSFESKGVKPLRIGVIRSIYYQKILEDLKNVEIVEYLTYSELMKSLAFGWIDIVVASEFTGLYTSRKYSLSNVMVAGPVNLPGIGDEDFRVGVLNDKPMLNRVLSKSVKMLSADTMSAISRKWLNYYDYETIKSGNKTFTDEEKAFIRNRPVVSIGMMPEFKPFSYYDRDDVYGYTRALLDLISSYSGIRFNMIVKPWHELLADFRNNKLDVLADMSYTQERTGYTLFTEHYYRIPIVVFVRDGFGKYEWMGDLQGRKVGVSRDVFYEKNLSDYLGGVQEFDSQEEMMRALSAGKVDAVVSALNTGKNIVSALSLMNVRVAGDADLSDIGMEDLRFGVQKGQPELRSILNKSLMQITYEEKQAVEQTWLTSLAMQKTDSYIPLTTQEISLIKSISELRVCAGSYGEPFVKMENNGAVGIIPDFMNLFRKRTGMQIMTVPYGGGQCGAVLAENPVPDGSKLYTAPVVTTENVIATSVKDPFITRLDELSGKNLGVIRGSALEKYLAENYPDIKITGVTDDRAGVKMLMNGGIYGYAGNIMGIGYQIQTDRIADIKISGRVPQDLELSIGVPADEPLLYHILQKAVAGLRDSDRKNVINSWMSVRFEQSIDYRLLWKVVAVFIVITLVIAYWTGKLKRLNSQLNIANEKLKHLSSRDQLTGLYNRYYFSQQGESTLNLCRRNGINLSMAIVDIDHFKNVNDTYGHVIGDECLKKIAGILSEHFQRKTDTIIRFGGEEFIVYAAGDSRESMQRQLEEIREQVEKEAFDFSGVTVRMTISAGVCGGVPSDETALEDCISRADRALYLAKNGGRNRVVCVD